MILCVHILCKTAIRYLLLRASWVSLGTHGFPRVPWPGEVCLACLFGRPKPRTSGHAAAELQRGDCRQGCTVALQPQREAPCLYYLGCLHFCSQNLQCKSSWSDTYVATRLHNHTYFYLASRGRSPTITPYLGTAKGETRRGLGAQEQPPRGAGRRPPSAPCGPWGLHGRAQPWHLPPSTHLGAGGRPWVGRTPLPRRPRCWGTEVPPWPRSSTAAPAPALRAPARSRPELVTAGSSQLRATTGSGLPGATAAGTGRSGACSSKGLVHEGSSERRAAGDPSEVERGPCAPEGLWPVDTHAGAGTALKEEQQRNQAAERASTSITSTADAARRLARGVWTNWVQPMVERRVLRLEKR